MLLSSILEDFETLWIVADREMYKYLAKMMTDNEVFHILKCDNIEEKIKDSFNGMRQLQEVKFEAVNNSNKKISFIVDGNLLKIKMDETAQDLFGYYCKWFDEDVISCESYRDLHHGVDFCYEETGIINLTNIRYVYFSLLFEDEDLQKFG